MDPKTFIDVATTITKLKMYPYFDVAHYILACTLVKYDAITAVLASQGGQAVPFQRRHPLSCWFSSMLMCFSGSIICNMILGEPIITPFKDHRALITASIIWYLLNYIPLDVFYKLTTFLPFKIGLCVMKEVHRVHSIYHGVVFTSKVYPSAYVVIVFVGIMKGNGGSIMRIFERLVRGIWIPTANEFLQPSFISKASLAASVIFVCERLHVITMPHPFVYLGVVSFFVYFKLSSLLLGIADPFVPLENLFCAIFMGGMRDALCRAVSSSPSKQADRDSALRADVAKSKEEKSD